MAASGAMELRGLKISQKPSSPPAIIAVKREAYLRSLAKLALVGLVLGLAFLIFWSAVVARPFDQSYVIELLARHDPGIRTADFVDMADPEGRQLFASDITMEQGVFALRDATVFTAIDTERLTSHVASGEALWLGPRPINTGPVNQSWACPGGTWLNISLQETDRYLYVGLAGNWPALILFERYLANINWTEENIDAAAQAANLTPEERAGVPELFRSAAKDVYASLVHYFNPADREAYEARLAELTALTAECQEVP